MCQYWATDLDLRELNTFCNINPLILTVYFSLLQYSQTFSKTFIKYSISVCKLLLCQLSHFYRATAMLSAVYAVVVCLCVSVSVCVCVSVTLRYCIKMAKRRIMQTMPHDSPMTLVVWCQRSRRNSNGITPYGGDKCRWGGLKFVTVDKKSAITRKRYKIDA